MRPSNITTVSEGFGMTDKTVSLIKTRSKFDPWRDAVLHNKRKQVWPVEVN